MSELNVYHHELRHNEYDEFYLKYEADKVIAELKAQKAQAEDDCAYWKTKAQRKRHHKFKRCLAMARSCKNSAEMFGCMAFHEKLKFGKTPYYQKCSLHANIQMCHEKKWLELAKKFKEG